MWWRSWWNPLRGPYMLLYRSLWEDLAKILLASSIKGWSRSFTLPCDKILLRSWWNPLGIFAWSRTGSCEKILWRSCWNPSQEVLASKILKIFEAALRWCWSESSSWMLLGSSLSRSSEILCIEGPSLTIFCTSPRCPGMRFWYEVLMSRHSDIALILVPTQVLLLQTRWCLAWSVTVP